MLLERERFPRYHIGESQLPWCNEVFEALGAAEAIAAAGFVEKWGATFRPSQGSSEQYADFEAAVDQIREHPLFKELSAKLDAYISPYDLETWRSPKDATAREFYSWDADREQ